jgi:hypothetical protein
VLANTSSTVDVDREMPREAEGRLAKLETTGFGFGHAQKQKRETFIAAQSTCTVRRKFCDTPRPNRDGEFGQ